MDLVAVGPFIFGENAPDSLHPRASVTLAAFYIDRTEVSNREYLRFVEATHRDFAGAQYALAHPEQPVTGVSEFDATAYAAWAGKRLPTEQEWEKAARGNDGRTFPWGSEPWTQGVPEQLQPVNSFPDRTSPYHVLNMAGNAWEWTATQYEPDEREMADMRKVLKSDTFSRTWYTLKGGSFSPNGGVFFKSYMGRGFPEDQVSPLVGFRCARDASKDSR
jgi:formylglycine-generating enzyme required for sulfatase activity